MDVDDGPEDEQHQIEDAARRYVLTVISPLWVAAGFADYLTHRQTRIERNAGLPESLLHAAQMTFAGVPVLAAMFYDVNALTLAITGNSKRNRSRSSRARSRSSSAA